MVRSAHTGLAPGFDPAWVTDASRKKSNKRGSSIEEGGKAVSTPDPSGDAYAPWVQPRSGSGPEAGTYSWRSLRPEAFVPP
jgi:hypothetical protein